MERDLLPFTLRSDRARSTAIYALRQRRSRPAATTADNATARASNGARSIAIYTKTAPQPTSGDQRRQQPTTQLPEPLTERDLLPFTLRSDGARSTAIYALRQRRSRPAATTADNATARASNGARSIAIYTKTARSRPAATSGDNSRQRNRQSL